MRKIIILITVLALIISIVGTGVIVYIETTSPMPQVSAPITSGENE